MRTMVLASCVLLVAGGMSCGGGEPEPEVGTEEVVQEGGEQVATGGCCDMGDNRCASGPEVTADNCEGTFHPGGTCRTLPDGGGVCGVLQE